MAKFNMIVVACICLGLTMFGQAQVKPKGDLVQVTIQTELGDIEVELNAKAAPVTVANFLRYVDAGMYNGGTFHRTVKLDPDNQSNKTIKIEVIQAGVRPDQTISGFPAIKLERTNVTGILHKDGVISMARSEPDTATSDFFICIGDQPELDFAGKRNPDSQGFAAFGRVIKGMEIVRKIQMSRSEGQSLDPPIIINHVNRLNSKRR